MRKEELKRRQIMARGKLDALIQETERVREVAENAPEILADLDEQFSRKTGLNKTDFVFLFLETALQVMRWVLAPRIGEAFNPDDRLKENDKSIKDEIPCRRIYRCRQDTFPISISRGGGPERTKVCFTRLATGKNLRT